VIRQRLLNAGSSKQHLSLPTPAASNSSPFQTSPLNHNIRPFFRPAAESTPPWIKRETASASAAATEAMASAARRLASQYAAAAAGHIPMTLMSPPAPLAMTVGLPLPPGVPLNASLHNLLSGIKSTAAPPTGFLPGAGSPRVPPSTPDSKRAGGAALGPLGVDPSSAAATGSDSVGGQAEQKVYRCDYCNKTFLFKSKYHEHLPVHTSARPFQCHLCTRTYKYKYDLRVHLRTHLGIPTKSTVCPFCAARFATNKFLRQHMRDAHADQNGAAASGAPPPAAVDSPAADDDLPPPAGENAHEDQSRDDDIEIGTDLVVDDSNEDAAVARSPSPPSAAEAVNSVGLNDVSSEI